MTKTDIAVDNFVEKRVEKMQKFVAVAVPGPFWAGLTYALADFTVALGCRVKVPLKQRQVVGVVVAFLETVDIDPVLVKPLAAVIDTEPLFNAKMLSLMAWLSDYYHHPLGECFYTAMPKQLCAGKALQPKRNKALPLGEQTQSKFTLNEEQQNAFDAVRLQHFKPYLLQGVAGSGKTEVYLQLIEAVLQHGQQALVLVPEIGLTPQIVARFRARFAVPIIVLHSALSEGDKCQHWHAAKTGLAAIIIGTRSAVFIPCQRLGIIVVDEEHDLSFKQQNGLRYSAREVAIKRAQLEHIPIILGSATPSLESLYHATVSHKYQHLLISKRAGRAEMPNLYVIDMRQQPLLHGLSKPLLDACAQQLVAGGQVLLFLNRRGYAPVWMCHACGWTACCTHCERAYTLHHYPPQLLCHHCLQSQAIIRECPKCKGEHTLIEIGVGTERIDVALQEYFKDYRVVRIDRTVTRQKGVLEKKLAAAESGEAQILIGTQMLAKGHHFPGVTLVGIIDVDAGLYSHDFRALERLGQLIVQVSGRAGRAEKAGAVYLQTHQPHHPLLKLLLNKGYAPLAEKLLSERKSAGWPPYGFLALFRVEALIQNAGHAFLQTLKQQLLSYKITHLNVWGPVPASHEKRANYYRWQLLLHAPTRPILHKALTPLLAALPKTPMRGLRWSIDVDPQEIGN